jgi:hypothetical protein
MEYLLPRVGPAALWQELQVPATRGFEAVSVSAPVHGATGIHDVFLTCNDGGFNLQSINSFGRSLRPT